MLNNIYLINTDDVKASTYVSYNVEDDTLATSIRTAQNTYLREIIGDSLLETLQEMVSGGTIDNPENAAYLDLLDNYVFEYLAVQAQVCSIVPLSYKIRNIGLSQDNDTNVVTAQMDGIREVESYLKTLAIDKANRIRCFLRENKAAFSELENQPCLCDSCSKGADLKLEANTNLWLG